MLYQDRAAILEPYATRLACARGRPDRWSAMTAALARAERPGDVGGADRDRPWCHEIAWAAADNRFLTDTLDMLYAQAIASGMYLAEVDDQAGAVAEHAQILEALVDGDADAPPRWSKPLVLHSRSGRRDAAARVTFHPGPWRADASLAPPDRQPVDWEVPFV